MEATRSEALARYGQLVARVDVMFRTVAGKYPQKFACGLGCHSCCKPGLTVNALEAAAISEFLNGHPELVAELREVARANPFRGERCSFLRSNGSCGIYDARPLVCRSHGAPLQVRSPSAAGEELLRDVCPLNFRDMDLRTLPAADVLNLDTVNTLLALLCTMSHGKKSKRVALTLDAILRAENDPSSP
jgi:Fe-S-cluster containining protein